MNIDGLISDPRGGTARVLGLVLVACAALPAGTAYGQAPKPEGKSVLSPGPKGNTVYLPKARGHAFCEFEIIEG